MLTILIIHSAKIITISQLIKLMDYKASTILKLKETKIQHKIAKAIAIAKSNNMQDQVASIIKRLTITLIIKNSIIIDQVASIIKILMVVIVKNNHTQDQVAKAIRK